MSRVAWKLVVVWGALGALAMGARAGAITIDGRFDDWGDPALLSTAERAESTGDGTPDGNDIAAVWAASDQDNLYLSVSCAEPLRHAHR